MTPSANSSVFSFFKKPVSPVQVMVDPDDLTQLNIREALSHDTHATGTTTDSYNALLQNAETLIKKVQSSHAENLKALRQVTSERNIQADELEACQTRNEHLKMQLLEMAEKAAEHERCIGDLQGQLNKHQQSIRMISDEDESIFPRQYRRSRHSDCSFSGDSMADSEISSVPSIFSEAESIRSPAASHAASPVMKSSLTRSPTLTMMPPAQAQVTEVLVPDCSNCHGVPASEAWDVIGIMKIESKALKERVSDLEDAQDAALSFLSGLHAL